MTKFRFSSTDNTNFKTPQEMFDDYKNKKITSIYDYQSKMIDLYLAEESGIKDIALELPTGTGKTLIGLLIGEFRRRKNKEKILYLCPNKQLVNQTVKHSVEDYGINATAFVGKAVNYSPNAKLAYNRAETIAVAPYSSLFNSNPFFSDADIIIFDDAHSGESYIASNWSVTINRDEDNNLFFPLLDCLKEYIELDDYDRMLSPTHTTDYYWFDMVPNIKLFGNYHLIRKVVSDYLQKHTDSDVRFPWSMIESHLSGCNIFISCTEIVIRPFIPPTLDFSPFANAKQRIYMSATLGKSGELERAFGMPKIKKLPMVKDWESKTIGRRFFIFPLASFEENEIAEILSAIVQKVQRTLIIVNDVTTQEVFRKFITQNTDRKVFTAKDIENSKTNFIKSDKAVAIVANRFDGIDFPDKECRMEILFDLQNATNIQEKFLTLRMCSTVLFSERIRSRLVQALGRCTRSNTDYAAVCIVGEDLMNALLSPRQLEQFNPELQAELLFGSDNSTGFNTVDEYLELLDVFLNDRKQWNAAEKDIINRRESIIKNGNSIDDTPYSQLNSAGEYEIIAQYCIWREDYLEALKNVEKVCGLLQHESLRGYLGFWLYIAAYCAFIQYKSGDMTYKPKYIDYLKRAASTTLSITWFNKLIDCDIQMSNNQTGIDYINEKIEAAISNARSKHPNIKSLFTELDELQANLNSGKGLDFEKAHETLGYWMGYRTTNPKGDAEPDPIWILHANLCIVSEDKIYDSDSKAIPTRHVREAAGHKNWVRNNFDKLQISKDSECLTVFITNTDVIEESALIQAEGIYYLKRDVLANWGKRCIDTLKELIISFSSSGDIVWRDKAVKLMTTYEITPRDYITMIERQSLANLKKSK